MKSMKTLMLLLQSHSRRWAKQESDKQRRQKEINKINREKVKERREKQREISLHPAGFKTPQLDRNTFIMAAGETLSQQSGNAISLLKWCNHSMKYDVQMHKQSVQTSWLLSGYFLVTQLTEGDFITFWDFTQVGVALQDVAAHTSASSVSMLSQCSCSVRGCVILTYYVLT